MNPLTVPLHNESGQGVVEYVLILVLVAFFLLVAFSLLGNGIVNALVQNIVAAF